MDNKNNELFNGFIDVPNNTNQNDLDYYVQPRSASEPIINDNDSIEVLQPNLSSDNLEILGDNLSQENLIVNTSLNSNTEPEILQFETINDVEQLNEQGKPINHELLKNLAKDTNDLVNPDMINPLGKPKEQNTSVNVEEPKVDYEEINTKKGYVFMAVVFLIIIVFIILLPKIIALLGF